MRIRPTRTVFFTIVFSAILAISCSWPTHSANPASENHVALTLKVPDRFSFVAFGDTRFHDPADTQTANAQVRQALVRAIDKERPAFVSIGGDIVYTGDNSKDWQVWDSETALWREHNLQVYPVLGNHDVKGDPQTALANYFARFLELQQSRYYSVRLGRCYMLVLDSNIDELTGPQGDWLRAQLDHLPSDIDFVFFIFHHPPYTSSNDDKLFGGGHSIRPTEAALGQFLEQKQKTTDARFVVFNGHVHNYERHEHGGVTYFVTGGGGAHAYPVPRAADDPYQDKGINYHYLLVDVSPSELHVTMNKLEFKDGQEVWTKPDTVTIPAHALAHAH